MQSDLKKEVSIREKMVYSNMVKSKLEKEDFKNGDMKNSLKVGKYLVPKILPFSGSKCLQANVI